MKQIVLLTWLAAFLVACSPNIQYIGRTYHPTDEVDLYFNSTDIKRPYETMGRVEGTGGIIHSDYSEIQEEIVKQARRKGADGVVIYNMEKKTVGQNSSSNTRVGSGVSDFFGKQTTVSTATTTSNLTSNMLRADFIKYK